MKCEREESRTTPFFVCVMAASMKTLSLIVKATSAAGFWEEIPSLFLDVSPLRCLFYNNYY